MPKCLPMIHASFFLSLFLLSTWAQHQQQCRRRKRENWKNGAEISTGLFGSKLPIYVLASHKLAHFFVAATTTRIFCLNVFCLSLSLLQHCGLMRNNTEWFCKGGRELLRNYYLWPTQSQVWIPPKHLWRFALSKTSSEYDPSLSFFSYSRSLQTTFHWTNWIWTQTIGVDRQTHWPPPPRPSRNDFNPKFILKLQICYNLR